MSMMSSWKLGSMVSSYNTSTAPQIYSHRCCSQAFPPHPAASEVERKIRGRWSRRSNCAQAIDCGTSNRLVTPNGGDSKGNLLQNALIIQVSQKITPSKTNMTMEKKNLFFWGGVGGYIFKRLLFHCHIGFSGV